MKAKNWYDSITPEQEEQLKTNDAPQGLSVVTDLLATIPKELRQYWAGDKWASASGMELWYSTYRLRPDWVRPTTAEKLVGYEVASLLGEYFYTIPGDSRHHSPFMPRVGYCGIEYAEIPGIFASAPNVFRYLGDNSIQIVSNVHAGNADAFQRIWPTPVKVWFREGR